MRITIPVISLAVLALVAVLSSDRRRIIVLFIIFGLLLALVWARLRAPDSAMLGHEEK